MRVVGTFPNLVPIGIQPHEPEEAASRNWTGLISIRAGKGGTAQKETALPGGDDICLVFLPTAAERFVPQNIPHRIKPNHPEISVAEVGTGLISTRIGIRTRGQNVTAVRQLQEPPPFIRASPAERLLPFDFRRANLREGSTHRKQVEKKRY